MALKEQGKRTTWSRGQWEEDQQAMTTVKWLNKNHHARMVQGEKQRAKKTQVTKQPSQAA